MDIAEILVQMGISEHVKITTLKREEDGTDYDVWRVEADPITYALKKTNTQELCVYNTFLKSAEHGAPRFCKSLNYHSDMFLLMEYTEGCNLQKCDRKSLTAVLDALIYLQNMYWERREFQDAGFSFEASLPGRQMRGKYLNDAHLEQA